MALPARIVSVDALRGLCVAAMLLVNNPGDWGHIYAPLQHAAWHGFTPTDLIFPLFVFIVGVSLALSLGARAEAADWTPSQRRQALHGLGQRALRVFGLGLLLHALAWWLLNKPEFRVLGVLQRLALCLGVTGALALCWPQPWRQWGVIAALLLGWGLLLAVGGSFDKHGSVAGRVDTLLLGRFAYEWDAASGRAFDPEGLLSTMGALASCLLGYRAGEALRHQRLQAVLAAALLACAAGGLLHLAQPINKQLWTPAFVLVSAGLSALLLLLSHVLVDRLGLPPLGRAFGLNAIAAYAGAWVMAVVIDAWGWRSRLYDSVFGHLQPLLGPQAQSLAYALAFVAAWALLVRFLDARRWYWKL